MAVHPQVRVVQKKIVKANIGPNKMDKIEDERERIRVWSKLLTGPLEPVGKIINRKIAGPRGAIPIRIYKPKSARAGKPMVVYFHGSAFAVADLDTLDETCRKLCNRSRAVIVSVDYGLAPENKFPSGLEDCYAATIWAAKNTKRLGCDPDKLIVAGDSAGGNMAAATCMIAREKKTPGIAYQVLVYPVTDLSREMSKYSGVEFGPTKEEIDWMTRLYVRDEKKDVLNPLVSPLLGELGGLPPALILTAGVDPLREQAQDFAKKLQGAGVRVKMTNYPGVIHGFWNLSSQFDAGDRAIQMVADAIKGL